jgi:hypothetical protein
MSTPKKPGAKRGLKDLRGKGLPAKKTQAIRGGMSDISITKLTDKSTPKLQG